MAKRAIQLAINAHMGWDENDHATSRSAQCPHAAQAAYVVFDVLQDIQTHDRIECAGGHHVVGTVGQQAILEGRVQVLAEPRLDFSIRGGVRFDADDTIILNQELSDVADSAPDFAYLPTDEWAYLIEQPMVVIIKVAQHLQGCADIVLALDRRRRHVVALRHGHGLPFQAEAGVDTHITVIGARSGPLSLSAQRRVGSTSAAFWIFR